MNDNSSADLNADRNADSGTGNELDPLGRLRAADPAAGVEPRAGFVDDVLARTVAAPSADHALSPEGAAAPEPAPVHDLTAERVRRRPRWLPIAAVAASIAIVGGAGFGLGATTNSSNLAGSVLSPGDGAAPPISLQSGPGAGGQAPAAGAAQGQVSRTGAGSAAGFAGDKMMMPWGFGRNSFSSSGLSTASGSAAGYGYDARAAATPERIQQLAAALGIEATAELKDGAWVAGPQDGTAPSLYIGLDGTLSFGFNNPQINPWQCDQAPDSTEPCAPPASLPSEQAAIDALRALVTAAGRDAGAFEFSSQTSEGSFTRTAQAWPVVDGGRLDQGWYIELTDAGTVSASGALAELVRLGDYAVVSEQEAFERLSDPRFGAQMTAMPYTMRAQTNEPYAEWVPPTEPPAAPAAGAALSWPVTDVEIVSARLGLTTQWQPDGSVLVVPAYEFTDAGGGTWSVIAVADSMLNFAGN